MSRRVIHGDPRWTLAAAAVAMRRERVGALMLIDDAGRLAGILTERDLLRALADRRDPKRIHVSEYMTQDPITTEATAPADQAAATMLIHGVRHLPVLHEGSPVGLVSVRDLLALHPWPPHAVIAEPW